MDNKNDRTLNDKLSEKTKTNSSIKKTVEVKKTNTKNKDMGRKKKSILPWMLLFLIGLMGLNGYQWFTQNKLEKDFKQQAVEFNEVKVVTAQLDKDYETAIESLEEMRGNNVELNELIDKQKAELGEQKKKIKGLIWTRRELKKAKTEIENISVLKDQYIAEVHQLRARISELASDNESLRNKNTELATTIESEKAASYKAIAAKDSLYANLNEKNLGLAKKVDMARAIKVNNIEVIGYKEKKSGKLRKRRKAKNIHVLRTCFNTETNIVTPKGTKNFKVRFIDPMGTTIYNEQLGSGVITEKLSQKDVQYTMSGDTEYENEGKQICIDYRPSNPLAKGVYKVEMFNNDYIVGTGEFILK